MGESLPEEWLRWYYSMHRESPVAHRGLQKLDGKRAWKADRAHCQPAAAGFTVEVGRPTWCPASQLVSVSGPFVRVHGSGVGEPGVLIPADSRVIPWRRRPTHYQGLCTVPITPGRHRLLFARTSVPEGLFGPPSPGLSGRAMGVVCAAAFTSRCVREAAGVYRFPRLPVNSLPEGSYIEHTAGGSLIMASGMLESILRRIIDRGELSDIVQRAGSGFIAGFSEYAFRHTDLRLSDMRTASTVYRLLCYGGLGGELSVYVRKKSVVMRRSVNPARVRFRSVEVTPVAVPSVILLPQAEGALLHISGLVFIPHVL